MTKQTEILEGTKIVVTDKDGTTYDAVFVSAKAGWANITVKGEAKKVRSKDIAVKMTKAELKKIESAARKVEKAAARAEAGADGEVDRLVPADLEHYVLHDTKTASGRRHIDVNDEAAAKMRELGDLPAIYKYAGKLLDEPVKELVAKYEHLNPGMQRMNLGNRIRKALKLAAADQVELAEDKKAA